MKVVFIHPDLGIGGAERLVLDFAVALDQFNFNVRFLTNYFNRKHSFQELENGRFAIQVFGSWLPQSLFGYCRALLAYIKLFYLTFIYMLLFYWFDKPDVFVVDQIPAANFILKIFKCKIVYYCHHPDLLASKRTSALKKLYRIPLDFIEEKGLMLSDVILVNSKYTASVFYKTFRKVTNDVYVLYPTISMSLLHNLQQQNCYLNELYPDITFNQDDFLFLSLNRYHPSKNIELVLDAMELLRTMTSPEDWAKTHLTIAGGYEDRSTINVEYYKKLVRICNGKHLTENVYFIRSLSEYVKADLLRLCLCVVYTPINEHFGIVPLEAMAAGKPVIACNSGGPCETVVHNSTGYLSEPNPDSFAQSMKKVLDMGKSRTLGSNGKKLLRSKFSVEIFDKTAVNIISKVCGLQSKVVELKNYDPLVIQKADVI